MKYVAPAIAGAVGHLQGGLIMDAGAVRVLVVTGLIAASSAHAQVTDAELACQAATAKAMGKFTSSRSKCITKCNQGARKGTNPPSDCTPGAFAGTTAACAEAAEEKAAGTEVKSCVKDCPECYDGDGTCAPGDCGCDSVELSEEVAAAIDLYAGFVYCDDSASGDGLTPIEAKCQDGTTKALAKFVGKRLRCFQQCHQKVQKGDLPAGSCDLPVSDTNTVDCLATASAKAAPAIDKLCEPPVGDRPECFGSLDGAGWTALIGSVVDGYDPEFFCGSPSGAFLEHVAR
jgi:hypothetical protein